MINVSDSVTYLKATISSSAASEYQSKTGKRITEGTLGNIIQLHDAEIVATHLGPRLSRITLLVRKFGVVGSDKSGQFGNPQPFEATQAGQQLLERLFSLRASNESVSRAQSVARQIGTPRPHVGHISAEDGHPASQQLLSQIPARLDSENSATKKGLTGLRLPQGVTDRHEYEGVRKPKSQAEALIKLMKAKVTAKSMSSTEAQRQVSPPKPASSARKRARTQVAGPSPVIEASTINPPPAARLGLASAIGSPRLQKGKQLSGNTKAMRIRSRDIKISNDQQRLLDQEDSWLPTEPGRRGPVANVPIVVLQEITQQVEQRNAKRTTPEAQAISEKTLSQAQNCVADGESDRKDDTDTESLIPSADWPQSPPVPAPRDLPPDSSMEMPDDSDNVMKVHSQHLEDASADGKANESDEALSSRRESTSPMVHSQDAPSQQLSSPPFRPSPQRAVEENPIQGPTDQCIASVSATRSQSWNRTNSAECIEIESTDSESELETTVPLNLSGQHLKTTDCSSTQEVPATAYELLEPVLQVKRTPYPGRETHRSQSSINQQSSASGTYSSPSKRRRIVDPEAPQKLDLKDFDQALKDPSLSPYYDSRSTTFAHHSNQVQTCDVEETVLAQSIEQESVQAPGSSTSPRSKTTLPATKQAQASLREASVASSMVGDPLHGLHGLRRKAEPPILSPYVSKRRKVHKSPFAFKFTQEEYPKEDPSIKARRHREEFFASRKKSHVMSSTSSHEIKTEGPRDETSENIPPRRDASRFSEERQTLQEPLYTPRRQSTTPRSGQMSPTINIRKGSKNAKGSISRVGEVSCRPSHETSIPPSDGSSRAFSVSDLERRMTSQMPIVASIEQPDLRPIQSGHSNLHSVSTKLEALSTSDISQQTNNSGQARSLLEMMTPALSIAEIPRRASSPIRSSLASRAALTQPEVFVRFRNTYPDYLGTKEHFLGMCKRIRQLIQADRMEHKSLWDDFIIRHKTDYPEYCKRCLENAEDAKPYEQFYHEEIDEPRYTKRLMQPATLGEVIPIDASTVATRGLVSLVKIESPCAHFGAQCRLSSVPTSRSSPAESRYRDPPVRDGKSPLRDRLSRNDEHGQSSASSNTKSLIEVQEPSAYIDSSAPKMTIDLTDHRSSSPSSVPRYLSSGPSPMGLPTPSPRTILWREEILSKASTILGGGRSHARNKGAPERCSTWKDLSRPVFATPSRKGMSASALRENSATTSIDDAEITEVKNMKPLQALQGPQQVESNFSTSLRYTAKETAASFSRSGVQSKQQLVDVDEWWKDDNTPFREYTRLYQSITPGKGNAWANEKGKEKGKGMRAETQRGKSSGIMLTDVMSWCKNTSRPMVSM